MATLAEQLADYVTRARYEDLPPHVVAHTKRLILDSLGVSIAGADTPWSQAALKVARREGSGKGNATILRYGDRTSTADAAFVNCIFAHSLDFNDDLAGCQLGGLAFPSALSLAEATGATGRDVILAVVLGYDVMTRIAEAANSQELYLRGFQPTALCGPFAVAAIAARFLKLDRDTLARAFGIAGSYAGGVLEFLKHGTDTKRLHVGKAAHGGIMAAMLAQEGMTGPTTIFEGDCGFFRAFCGTFTPEKLLEELGSRFDVMDTSVKAYPFCDGAAPPVEAALAIIEEQKLRLDQIKRIHARIKTFLVQYAVDYHGDRERKYRPKTMLDAQMSLPYCLAVALLNNGTVRVEDFTKRSYSDPEILKIADKVTAEGDAELDKVPFRPMSMPSIVTIETTDGRSFTRRVDYQKGDPRNAFSDMDFVNKFRACVQPVLGERATEGLIEVTMGLDDLKSMDTLVRLAVQ